MKSNSGSTEWPSLPYADWENTRDTVHMWTQIVGKTRLALDPLVNHWWNVALYVTPAGLTTSSVPYHDKSFEAEFDFISRALTKRERNSPGGIVKLSNGIVELKT